MNNKNPNVVEVKVNKDEHVLLLLQISETEKSIRDVPSDLIWDKYHFA